MQPDTTPILTSANGQVFHTEGSAHHVVRFGNFWIVLRIPQIEALCTTMHCVLNCAFRQRHLDEGLLLRCPDGERRMPLTLDSALELQGLLNDILLLVDAERSALGSAPATTD